MTEQTLQGEELLQEIGKHVYLVVLNVSWPKLQYQISDAIVEVAGAGSSGENLEIAEKFRNKPQWTLMPRVWHTKFQKTESKARATLAKASLAFASKGMAILPISRAGAIFEELHALRDTLETDRDNFILEYGNILQNLQEELGPELYDKASRKIPTESQIHQKFGMRWPIFPMGGGMSLSVTAEQIRQVVQTLDSMQADLSRLATGTGSAASTAYEEAAAIMATLLTEMSNPVNRIGDESAMALIGEAREQMNQIASRLVDSIATEPRQQLADAIDYLLEAIRSGRAIRNGTISAVERAFELVRGFSFLADDELLARIREGEAALQHVTVQEVNASQEIGARLAGALRHVQEQAANANAALTAVRKFRGIRIRP